MGGVLEALGQSFQRGPGAEPVVVVRVRATKHPQKGHSLKPTEAECCALPPILHVFKFHAFWPG